jgi:hypothetical protein
MAKRAIVLTAIFALLAVPLCFAQNRAGVEPSPEGQTTFGSIEVTGLTQGAPGYIALIGADGSTRYYLWVGHDHALHIASEVAVGYGASPARVAWTSATTDGDASGPKVGP